MTSQKALTPSERLRSTNPAVSAAFQTFRDTARAAGPLDHGTVELILLAGFSVVGQQEPFKNHAMRALRSGVAKEALQQAVMVTLGATSILPAVANSLRWIEEVAEAYRTKSATDTTG
jgi:alkylhydroperoxidase/carboxymuconolactone decarboxylase family protein YurZ